MHNYIVWLACKQSEFHDFYEIVTAPDRATAKRMIENDKRFSEVVVLSVQPQRK